MGIAMSLVGKMGMPVSLSALTDRIFDQFFSKEIKTFEEFHIHYLEVCNKLNSTMIGQHYVAPEMAKIKECYNNWSKEADTQKKKDLIVSLLTDHVKLTQTDPSVMMTALVVPPAAMILKRAGENVPQVKRFRLNLVPDYLFVPAVTFFALFGTKALKNQA
ncbi:unnamed protein product [Spirodela intermedia]|uniref:Uncharacterized protein n=1 Tax=Spirodela intermedia TaxID=51605 RepID=A0A7I8LM59_SPIIN|nr:unnamed protein product [Spirodela intermedia]